MVIGSTSNELTEMVTTWYAAQTFHWECGDNGEWPAVVAAFWIPFFILLIIVGFSTCLDSTLTYNKHMFNKRVNSEGGYNMMDNSSAP